MHVFIIFQGKERYLIEKSLWELLETLCTDETLLVIKLPVAVHYLFCWGEAALAALTHGVGQGVGHVAEDKHMKVQSQVKVH